MFKCFSLLILSVLTQITFACTHIITKTKDNAFIVGRTMEFGPDLKSQIKTKAKGFEFKNPEGEKKSRKWTGQFDFVYLNGFGLDMAVDGLNEKGLSVSALYLPGYTTYAKAPDKNTQNSIPYFQLGEYILSQFENVDDVQKDLDGLVIFDQGLNIKNHPNTTFPLHYAVTDSKGKSIVLEFNKGQTKIYDNPLGVLTNAPTFDWQMNNLKNYANLSPDSPHTITVDGFDYSATGQGGGMVGLPGDTTPPSRFVKMAFLTKTAKPVVNAEQGIILTAHILNNVYIPDGLVRTTKQSNDTETTQWTVFKDLSNGVLYFKSYHDPSLKLIDLKKINYKSNHSLPVDLKTDLAINKTHELNDTLEKENPSAKN